MVVPAYSLVGARLFGEEDFGSVLCFGLNLNLSNSQQSWPAEVLFIKETGCYKTQTI